MKKGRDTIILYIMYILKSPTRAEFMVKNSRFIAEAVYVDTPEGSRPPYPWLPFWEMAAEANVKAVIGMDAHRPEDVSSNYAEVRAFADKLGIRLCEKEVVQKILQKKS